MYFDSFRLLHYSMYRNMSILMFKKDIWKYENAVYSSYVFVGTIIRGKRDGLSINTFFCFFQMLWYIARGIKLLCIFVCAI